MFGNVITVTEANSTSPETEREILTKESYGRQLGRMMDAVAALIEERPKDLHGREEFDALLEVRDHGGEDQGALPRLSPQSRRVKFGQIEGGVSRGVPSNCCAVGG